MENESNTKQKKEKYWREAFEFTLWLKGFNGIWETATGLSILFLSRQTLHDLFYLLANKELLEDPNDKLINFLSGQLSNLSHNFKTFAAIYILVHGIINLFLVYELVRGRLWAYLVAIGVGLAFMAYQVHRIVLHHSIFLSLVTVFDAIFMMLAWHEYKFQKSKHS